LNGPVPVTPNEKLQDLALKFEVDETRLVPQPHRNHGPEKSKFLEDTLDEWIAKGYADLTNDTAYMQMTVVTKSGGAGFRTCMDARSLNHAIKPNTNYPLPDIRVTVRRAAAARFRSVIDLKEAFFQLCLHPTVIRWCTGSTGRGGRNFRIQKLFFGLLIATSYFQYVICYILAGCKEFAAVYVDDIIIFSNTLSEHLKHIEKVLQKMREFGLRFAVHKCEWLRHTVTFLGFDITTESFSVNDGFVTKLLDAPKPTNVKQLQSFLGKINWVKGFIPGPVGENERLLRQLISESTQGKAMKAHGRVAIKWSDKYNDAWSVLMNLSMRQLRLAPLESSRHTFLETDASDTGMGAVLFQKKTPMDNERFLCALWSRPFTAVEQQWGFHS